MMWNSFSEFLDMGGYAFYVWMSFGFTLGLMILEPLFIRQNRKSLLNRIAQLTRAQHYQKDKP